MPRTTGYFIAALSAAILTILPAALWPDMAMPMKDNWENWYWEGQPHPRPSFSLQNPPRLFRAEMLVYKALVIPPAYLSRAVTGSPTEYGTFFIAPYRETSGFPPLAMALEHARWAFPTWFAALVMIVEFSRLLRARMRRRRAALSITVVLLLVGNIVVVRCRVDDAPARPSNLPASAVWAGGSDGGAWISCEFESKEPYVTYRCETFSDVGAASSRGAYVLAAAAWNRDGSRRLSPLSDGDIDYPFGDGHGKRARYQLGKPTAAEVQH